MKTTAATALALLLISAAALAQRPSPEAVAHIKRGIEARQQQRLDEAARELQAALKLAPEIAEVHAEMGLVHHQQGNPSAAAESFRKALQIKPDLRGVFGLLGYNLLMTGQAAEALEYLEKASQDAPDDTKLKAWVGLAYLRSGNPTRAIATLEPVRESEPGNIEVLLYLAEAHRAALAALREEAFRLDPERAKRTFDTDPGSGETEPRSPPGGADASLPEQAIREACTQCHKWTPPAVLPKEAWFGKTAKMFSLANKGLLSSLGRPIRLELEDVAAYFQKLAPAELNTPVWEPSSRESSIRLAGRALSGVPAGGRPPGTSNVRLLDVFDDNPGPELIVCDMISGWVSWADPRSENAQLEGLAQLSNPDHAEAVDLDQDGLMDLIIADLGEVMPSDKTDGAVIWLRQTDEKRFEVHPLVENIGRVADVQAADFDGDGDLDLVVAEFGWITVGRILYLENQPGTQKGQRRFEPVTLDSRTGSIHVPVADLDQDGKPDFLALISQHHETIVAFLNRGPGQFEKREVFSAPHPHWGSSGMEAVDFDQDGDIDVLLTNGDTMDDMIRFKPYQGVAWLENRGQYPFEYHPIGRYYGAMRAEAGDLDGDGDLDVVASCWIPELADTERQAMRLPGVVWFEQTAQGAFEPHTLIDDACDHPTLELGDVNSDGSLDVITGTAWLGKPPQDRQPAAVQIWTQQ